LVAKRKKTFGKTFIIQDRRLGGEGEKKKEKKMTMVIRKKKEVI
jgi:hypothetical protein